MKPPLLTVENLSVGIHTAGVIREIVHRISFQIGEGEALALVGESGCGKSLTAQAILQLSEGSRILGGEIWFQGEPLHLLTPKKMRAIRGKAIAMIFQDPMTSLNPTMRIGAQIAEPLIYHMKLSRQAAYRRTVELLDQVGIADPDLRYLAYPFELSGGMRQRVMIAMALACAPQLLIADEPTTALDVTVQAQILNLLQAMRQQTGMSLLMITHDFGVVAKICDRAAIMHRGTLVETQDVFTLFRSPEHPYTKALLAQHIPL